jgi:hypothetical protein
MSARRIHERTAYLLVALSTFLHFCHRLVDFKGVARRNDPEGDRATFRLIAVQERVSAEPPPNEGEFPTQVEGILEAVFMP